MDKFGKSQPVRRVEDQRFLTGMGRYVDDLAPSDALQGYVLRSPVAHAEITELDLAEAREMDGVHLVLGAEDLKALGVNIYLAGAIQSNRDGSKGAGPKRPVLAEDRVRFVGEPIAMIFADTMQQARDAAEAIMFDFDELPVHIATDVGGPVIHPEAPENLAFDWGIGDEAGTEAALDGAAHRLSFEIGDNRVICNSMEPRGCYAEPMEGGRLHVALGGQGVWGPKGDLAKALGVDPEQVRVTNPDVGGGFGMKGFMYPEYVICAAAARHLDRPVRWMSDRTEAMLSDNGGRDLVSRVEMGFDADHKMTAYKVNTVCNLGAYNSGFAQFIQTDLFSKVMTGTYNIPNGYLQVEGVYTNTTQVDAYRGAGRPEAIYLLERAMDCAARALGADPWELRRSNFIQPDQFPYTTPSNVTYDIGDFDRVLTSAEGKSDVRGFADRRNATENEGKLRGMGLCYYIESILGDPSETAKVAFEEEGGVSLYVGTQSNGQGHETVYAQFLADHTGIPADQITVVQGDSDRIKTGGGTGGSRSVTVQNTATLATVETMVTVFTPMLAAKMGVDEAEVEFDDEQFRAPGSNESFTMMEAAQIARDEDMPDLLTHEASITLDARSFPNGAHIAEVVIDPDTGIAEVDRYTVVDDFGNLINPMLVEGQIHGGVAQGLGQALLEHVVYDEDGQLLTATFMDYTMPRANDLPMIHFSTEAVPTSTNPMGMKGCGEAGTVGALAAIANAVQDAIDPSGAVRLDMPFTAERVWRTLKDIKARPIAAE